MLPGMRRQAGGACPFFFDHFKAIRQIVKEVVARIGFPLPLEKPMASLNSVNQNLATQVTQFDISLLLQRLSS
jgi:hypothetical protein